MTSTSNGYTTSKNKSLLQIPKNQRVMILQGGGALGAYELGVFKAIYEKIMKDEGQEEAQVNLFDIVAGASIGAINAVLLVNHFLNNNKSWKDSPDELEMFWKELTAHTWAEIFLNNTFSDFWWNLMRTASYNYIASAERAGLCAILRVSKFVLDCPNLW
jgi:NTE family protein